MNEASVRRIERLSEHVANQIAAGEVVARPASVVKELLENAVDAGARTCRVEIEGGGVGLVRVFDDGSGMDRGDARRCIERHATSKLTEVAELSSIATFGFRGEALPSIASVSRFAVMTRRAQDDEGTRTTVTPTGDAAVEPWGGAPGTIVEVRDLFFNVPARRKFLRVLATEAANVTEVVRDVALAHPALQLELVRDGRTAKRWLRAAGRAERVLDVLGGPLPILVAEERGPIRIEAYLAPPERARTGAGGLKLFVNGRPVADRAIARAAAFAFGAALGDGRYPVGAIFLDVPGTLVDVNVHPQKAEVRFAQPGAVTDAVSRAVAASVARTLGATTPMRVHEPLARPFATRGEPAEPWHFAAAQEVRRDAPSAQPTRQTHEAQQARLAQQTHEAQQTQQTRAALPEHEAQQAQHTPSARRDVTWLAELDDGVWLLSDSHGVLFVSRALAEARVLSHRACTELASAGRLETMPLLFPLRIELNKERAAMAEEQSDALERLGLELRVLGPTVATLRTAPRAFSAAAPSELLEVALGCLAAGNEGLTSIIEAWARDTVRLAARGPKPSANEADALVLNWCDALEGREPRRAPEVLLEVTNDLLRRKLDQGGRGSREP